MTRRKSRASKSALNTTTEYNPTEEKEIKVEITEEKAKAPEVTPEFMKMFEEELEKEMENTELPTQDEIEEELEVDKYNPPASNYPDKFPAKPFKVEKKKEITKKDLMALSKKGLRYYQRTGKLPQE